MVVISLLFTRRPRRANDFVQNRRGPRPVEHRQETTRFSEPTGQAPFGVGAEPYVLVVPSSSVSVTKR